MFLMSNGRGESDLGMCMTSRIANRMRLSSADFRFSDVFGRKIRRESTLRSNIFFASLEVMHRRIRKKLISLHFDIKNI